MTITYFNEANVVKYEKAIVAETNFVVAKTKTIGFALRNEIKLREI